MSEIDDFCKNLTIKYDEEASGPIFQTEEGGWLGVGHFQPESFLNQVWDLEIALGNLPEDEIRDSYGSHFDVHHVWAVLKGYDDLLLSWDGVTENTPGSIPVTVLLI